MLITVYEHYIHIYIYICIYIYIYVSHTKKIQRDGLSPMYLITFNNIHSHYGRLKFKKPLLVICSKALTSTTPYSSTGISAHA